MVTVTVPEPNSEVIVQRRARLLERTADGFLAEIDGSTTPQPVTRAQISKRVRLPWKPSDLRDYLVIFPSPQCNEGRVR